MRHHFNYIEAQNFGVLFSIYMVLYVLLGGTQTVFGPLFGAAVFTLLPELLRGSAAWRYVIFAVLIIAIMSLRPQGRPDEDPIAQWLVIRCEPTVSKSFGGLKVIQDLSSRSRSRAASASR